MTSAGSQTTVLALNSGSSSLKFGLYRVSASRTEELLSGAAEAIGNANGKFHAQDSQGSVLTSNTASIPNQQDALIGIGRLLDGSRLPAPVAIGHRIVHGGPKLRQHCLIDEPVMQQLEYAASFAPLHAPSALSGGVIMGSRSGDLDPDVLIYLMREQKFDSATLEDLINQRSGVTGISGVGSDMRRLHDAASSNPDARLAIDMFCSSVRKQITAMMAVLGGVDLVVFTGGIGENDGKLRASICAGLSWAGVNLDVIEDHANASNALAARVLVLPFRKTIRLPVTQA